MVSAENNNAQVESKGFFDNSEAAFRAPALRSLGRAVRTIIVVPPHDEVINVSMKAMRLAAPLPQQPSIAEVQQTVREIIAPRIDKDKMRQLPGRQLARLAGALIQFSDHLPALHPAIRTSYSHIRSLYDEVTTRAADGGKPLTFPEQLDISLMQNDGDLPNSLWQLFMASRFYARRRDGQALIGAPQLSSTEKLDSMMTWQQSLAACVPYEKDGYQDAAGDTYYTWTHALAKVAFGIMPERPSAQTRLAESTFEHGTIIMQAFVNRFYPEGGGATARNHITASHYGNAIGQACIEALNT